MSNRFKMMGGLGDVLILGAALQVRGEMLDEVQYLVTNPVLEPIFRDHPHIDLTEERGDEKMIVWPSQLPQKGAFNWHTMNRFAHQLGLQLSPHDTMDIWQGEEKVLACIDESSPYILVNDTSAERTRRYIPLENLETIEAVADEWGYDVRYIGATNTDKPTVTDIPEMIELMRGASCFVGPVSFPYHLAGCIGTPSVCFFSYMPEIKFSHAFNTTPVNPSEPYDCVWECERDERAQRGFMNCWDRCHAVNYHPMDIRLALEKNIAIARA